MCSAGKKELIEVVKYFRDELDWVWQRHIEVTSKAGLTLLSTGAEMMQMAQTIQRDR